MIIREHGSEKRNRKLQVSSILLELIFLYTQKTNLIRKDVTEVKFLT